MSETFEKMLPFTFECRCPEPERPGWFHRSPIECSPLAEGESIEEWRGRRYDGIPSVPHDLAWWRREMASRGWAVVGVDDVGANTAEGYGHRWDRIVLGYEFE